MNKFRVNLSVLWCSVCSWCSSSCFEEVERRKYIWSNFSSQSWSKVFFGVHSEIIKKIEIWKKLKKVLSTYTYISTATSYAICHASATLHCISSQCQRLKIAGSSRAGDRIAPSFDHAYPDSAWSRKQALLNKHLS